MPNRLIRDGLLDSEAVLSLPVEARWLYVSILLSADDVGLFEATPFRLARRADLRRDHAERIVQHLVDADLIRLYSVDGKAFGFIPRFGQRLQIKRARCPLPPVALLTGDEDAIIKINNLASNPTVSHGGSPESTAVQQPEPEPEPEKKKERKSAPKGAGAVAPSRKVSAPDDVLPEVWEDWLTLRKAKRAPVTATVLSDARSEAKKAGMSLESFFREWCSRGSQGLRADWLKTNGRGKQSDAFDGAL